MDKATIVFEKLAKKKCKKKKGHKSKAYITKKAFYDELQKEAIWTPIMKGLSLASKGLKFTAKAGGRAAKASYAPTKKFLTKNPVGRFASSMGLWVGGPAAINAGYTASRGRQAGTKLQSAFMNPSRRSMSLSGLARRPQRGSGQFTNISNSMYTARNANMGIA